MYWLDFNIEQAGKNFRIKGDWEGEVMGINKDGTVKEHYLYKPGDVFIVDDNGWLCKVHNRDDGVNTEEDIELNGEYEWYRSDS